MNRLVSRSLEILGQATKAKIGEDYASNLTTFINDAKVVKDSIVKSTTDATDTFVKLKTMNITKKISDWFYQEENSSDASNEEFDAGFKIDSSEDAKLDGDKSSPTLNVDSMSSIMEKQSGMMVKIGRRQTEQSIANTAEVISVVNSRTSEMIASMNNINKSLIGINEKLDQLIKLQSYEETKTEKEDKSGVYDSSGNLSLTRIFEQAKENFSNNSVVSTAQMMGQMITGGGGPVDVAKFLLGFGLGKPLNSLGGESIDSLGKKFNEMIGTAIQTGLSEAIKSGPFKALFDNITQFEGDKDYGTIAANNYTTKKAMFDGMTRMSIVNVIPEYLAKINQALSGETWHVDSRGRLVKGPVENKFNEVTRNAFASSGISSSAQNKILATGQRKFGDKISANDINEAGRALCGAIVMFKHYNGNSEGAFSVSDLKKDMSQYIFAAVNTLCNTPGRNDPEYWYSVCQMIVSQLASGLMDAAQFVRNVNTSLDNMKMSAIEVAKSGKPESLQAGRLTNDIMIEQWIATHQDANKDNQQTSTQTQPTPTPPTDGNTNVERVDKYYIDGKHTTGDFIRGIFGILNRGINVKVLDRNDTSWKFDDYDLERQTVKQEIIDSKAAELFGQWVAGGKDNEIGDVIRKGVKDSLESMKNGGKEAVGDVINGAKNSFLSNMLSTLGANSIRDLGNKVFNGEFKGFFKEGGKGREMFDNIKSKASDLFGKGRQKASDAKGALTDAYDKSSLKYDKRFAKVKDSVVGENGVIEKGKGLFGKASDALSGNKTFQKMKGSLSRAANNAVYNKDQLALGSAKSSLANFNTDAISDETDQYIVRDIILEYVKQGEYDKAKEELEQLRDDNLKSVLKGHLDKITGIRDKRSKGEAINAKKEIDEVDSSEMSDADGVYLEMIKELIANGDYAGAKELAEELSEGKIKKSILKNLDILEKNLTQGSTLAEGEVPDIGATLQTAPAGDKTSEEAEKNNPIVKVLKKGFSLIGKWFKKSAELIANGSIDILYGLKNLGSGLKQTFSVVGKSLKKTLKPVKDAISKVGKTIKGAVTGAFSKMGDLFSKFKPRREGESKSGEGNKEQKKSLGERLGDKIRSKGAFGASFMAGFDEAREAKKKLSRERERASSFINSSVGDIWDVITGKKSMPESPFNQLIDIVKGFRSDVNGNHEEDEKAKAAEAAKNKKNKNNNDPNNSEGGEEDSDKGKIKNAKDVISAVKGEDGGPGGMKGLVEGIGKTLGSITQILAGIGEMALGIVMGMEGFQSLMNIGTEILQDILEPIDKIFKELKKAIDSLLEPIKNALHSLVEIVVDLVVKLFDILKPIFDMIDKLLKVVTDIILDVVQVISDILDTVVDMLSSIIDTIVDILVPLLDVISDVLNMVLDLIMPLLDVVADIVNMLMDIVVPILEAVGQALSAVISILNPILDIICVILDAVLVPILLVLDILQPIIEGIGYAVKIISGVLQFGMGIIIGILGSLLKGVGLLISALGSLPVVGNSTVKSLGSSIESTADGMLDSSKALISGGLEQMKEGLSGIVSLAKSIPGRIVDTIMDVGKDKEDEETKDSDVKLDTTDFGAGDVNTNTINNSWSYTYGSGNSSSTTMNQHSYGGYMNMSERGCGPVVLADAYNRRNGGRMNPATLAASMMGSGTYDPRRGTSVGSMIDTGNAMGMGMRMGGVTQQSLKQASPSNPITVLGSGTGFGTKSGNNHYVNVVGTDKNGGAYVANPMTGRVERQSASNLALNAKLGLYGSGDNEYEQYGFSEELTESFAALKELTDQLTGIFQGPSEGDAIEEKRKTQRDAQDAETIRQKLSEDEFSAIEEEARNKLQTDNPKRDGESDEDYQKRIDKLWAKKGNSLIVQLGGQQYADKVSEMADMMRSGAEEMQSAHNSMTEGMHAASSASLTSGSSKNGVFAVMAPYDPIRYTEANIDTSSSPASGASPVHDFFSATSGFEAFSTNGLWFEKSDAPVSKEGVGSTGNDHEGIGIRFYGDDAEVHAITEGTVTFTENGGKNGGEDPNGGLGNHVKWRDKAGMYHWYLHLNDIDKSVQEGSNIEAGQLIGHVGSTGATGYNDDTQLLRYILTKSGPAGSTGDAGFVNPLTYWKFEEGGSNAGPYKKTDAMGGSFWSDVYANKLSNSDYHDQAQKAGLTGAQEAMVAAIAIHEDSAKKITGEKSLTTVTADKNGQTAFGLMNWIPDPQNRYVGATETKYGTTLADQLPEMRKMYFDSNPTHDRARIVNYNDYASAMQTALGHAPTIKQGDPWGPLAETDIAESMGHYVANALIPEGWNTAAGLGKHMGTAVDVYNWMIDKGWINVGGGANSENEGDENKITGRFVSTISNAGGGSTGDLIEAAAQVWEVAGNTLGPVYDHGNRGPMTTRSGVTLESVHPDCSGMISAAMNYMGYTFDTSQGAGTCDKYRWCTYDIVKQPDGTNNFVLGPDGSPSPDWVFMKFNPNDMQEGDIISTYEHVGLYVQPGSDSVNALGFDAGNGDRLPKLAQGAAKAYLDGDDNWRNQLEWTMGPGYSGLMTTLRYVGDGSGGGLPASGNENAGQHRGGFTNAGIETNRYSGPGPYLLEDDTNKSNKSNSSSKSNTIGAATWEEAKNKKAKSVTYNALNADDWLKMPASERSKYYKQLIDYNKQANKKSVNYASNWGTVSSDSGNLKPDSERYWRSAYSDWAISHANTVFPDQLAEMRKVLGKGDVSDWDIGTYIPPVDMSKFDQYDISDNSPIQQFFQKYEVVADTSSKMDVLEKMSKMTFNVRAQRVEELLEELIEKVSGDKPEPPSNNTDGYDPNLFKNDIPEQVSRLARG